ncbi:MAG: relaxase MobL [Cetobacterium sp.]|nr:relaxase MobL [Cetobacterium sp.]
MKGLIKTSKSPAVNFMSKFITHTDKLFKSYIDYINRNEAIRNGAYQRYSLYNEYMGNPEKTTGIFTNDSNRLTQSEKDLVKEKFALAQENKSVMWQEVYSFNNDWLKKQGLYDPKTKVLDEDKIKNAIRKSIEYSLEKTGIKETALWSGAIHYNTDNIHIHVAICEPNPTRTRGKRTRKTIETMRSKFVNHLLDFDEEYKEINKVLRENLVKSSKYFDISKDTTMKKLMNEVVNNLPPDSRHWHYNYNTMNDAKVPLNKLTKYYIDTYKKNEYIDFINKLDKHEKELREIYGEEETKRYKDYKQNKIDELYTRMGNAFLSDLKVQLRQEKINQFEKQRLSKDNLYKKQNQIYLTKKTLYHIKKSLGDEFDNVKNQSYYQSLQNEIEYNM